MRLVTASTAVALVMLALFGDGAPRVHAHPSAAGEPQTAAGSDQPKPKMTLEEYQRQQREGTPAEQAKAEGERAARLVAWWQQQPRRQISAARGSAKVLVVEYTSVYCPPCSTVHRELRKAVAAFPAGMIAVVQQNLVSDCRVLHEKVELGFVGRCEFSAAMTMAADRPAFADWAFQTALEDSQINARDFQSALERLAGIRTFAERYPQALAGLDREAAEARRLGITLIPLLFINGRQVPELREPDLRVLLAAELQAATAR